MKQILLSLLVLSVIQSISQTKETPKPQFFSVVTLDEVIGDYHLISNYYPLKGNIENKGSTIFVADTPTLDQIEAAAINNPSDFFLVSRNKVVLNKIMLINMPARNFFVASPQTGNMDEFECRLKGDLTENRANEIVFEKYDTTAKIEGDKLYFNHKEFDIIPREEIKRDVLTLIYTNQLSKALSPSLKKTSK